MRSQDFGFHVASMVVRPAEPPAIGVTHCGFPCDNVVAVSEADLCRTPLPWAAIIDCRPLLLGWDAVFSTADTWSLEDMAVGISTFCPRHWHARILGVHASSGRIPFHNGQVFTALFMRDGYDSSSESASSRDAGTDHSSAGSQDLDEVSNPGPARPSPSAATGRDRSRSPPSGAPANSAGRARCVHVQGYHFFDWLLPWVVACAISWSSRVCSALQSICVAGGHWSSIRAAARLLPSHGGSWAVPSVGPAVACRREAGHLWRLGSPWHLSSVSVVVGPSFCSWAASGAVRAHKWLTEPVSSTGSLRHALAALRYFAPRLGQAWRYVPAHNALFIQEDNPFEDSASDEEAEVTAYFAVAVPGYALEMLQVTFVPPPLYQK